MSDFLNNFENEEKKESIISEEDGTNDTSVHINDEIIEDDEDYEKNKKKKIIKYSLIGAGALVLLILFVVWLNIVKVPDFQDKSISSAKNWANEKGINLTINKVYSSKFNENKIVSQNISPNSYIFKNNEITLTISQGADPEEVIMIPNIIAMNIDEINNWIDENKLENVTIEPVYSNSRSEGSVIDFEYPEDFVSGNNFKRKNAMVIKVSQGSKQAQKNITVPNFRDGDKYDVEIWGEENNVNISYIYQPHPKVSKDSVIKQSIPKGKKITKNDTITVYISVGKGVRVPDFSKISKESAGMYKGLNISVESVYSYKYRYGKFMSQTIRPGTVLYSNKKIVVTYSEGKPYIDNISGYTVKQVEQYFYKINKKKANLRYKFCYVKSSNNNISTGSVVKTSKQNQYAYFNELIYVALKGSKNTCDY